MNSSDSEVSESSSLHACRASVWPTICAKLLVLRKPGDHQSCILTKNDFCAIKNTVAGVTKYDEFRMNSNEAAKMTQKLPNLRSSSEKVKWKSSFYSFPRFRSIKSSSSCFYSFLRFNFANIRVIFPFSCLQVSLKHFSLVSWIFHVLWEDRNIPMSMTWKTWRWHSK